MPTRTAALALAAVALLGSTGCEKQSPYVTVTAHGVTVKARATKYCRPHSKRCNESADNPVITVQSNDVLGIDVPRSLAEQGWQIDVDSAAAFSHEHYTSLQLGQIQATGRDQVVTIVRDPKFGEGTWRFTLRAK
jgi:hypothetical protein